MSYYDEITPTAEYETIARDMYKEILEQNKKGSRVYLVRGNEQMDMIIEALSYYICMF